MSNIRITVACPEALISDASQLAMVLGQGPDDGRTYGVPGWQDAEGNLYAAASFVAPPAWITGATQPLTRPAWDVAPYRVNMAGASRAQAALVIQDSPAPAMPGLIGVLTGIAGTLALQAMGLRPLASEDIA